MRRAAAVALAAALWAGLPSALGAADACAAPGEPRAALVVDTGEQVLRYCVVLPDDEVSGIDVIVAAGEQHGLSYHLGFGGKAVCMLAGVGPTGDDCFEDYPYFWGYWRGESGGWSWSSTGAASTTVGDGDVEGWSWGIGDTGAVHPQPPPTAFADVCPQLSEPSPAAPAGGGRGGAKGGGGGKDPAPASAPAPSPAPGASSEAEKRRSGTRPAPRRNRAAPGPSPLPRATSLQAAGEPRAAAPGRPAAGDGPPPAGLAALALTLVLAAGGAYTARRRAPRP